MPNVLLKDPEDSWEVEEGLLHEKEELIAFFYEYQHARTFLSINCQNGAAYKGPTILHGEKPLRLKRISLVQLAGSDNGSSEYRWCVLGKR